MTPISDSDSDFDARLRDALGTEAASAFDDTDASARAAVVSGVRGRHQRRVAVVGGLAAVAAAVAIVAAVGVGGSGSGGSHPSEALPARVPAAHSAAGSSKSATGTPTPPSPGAVQGGGAGSGSASGVGGATGSTSKGAAAPSATSAASCATASVGRGKPVCAGRITQSGFESAAPSYGALNAPLDSPGVAAPAPVNMSVGEHLTIRLTASSSLTRWTAPTVFGRGAVLGSLRTATKGDVTTTKFVAARSGTTTLVASEVCKPAAKQGSSYPSYCQSQVAQWQLKVEVTK